MNVRKIVQIDESKCDGCGLCVPSCAEGAIQIRDGKARLVSDVYCDGLGACLGECPRGAITIVDREAEAFDEEAARRHAAQPPEPPAAPLPCGCPGTVARSLEPGQGEATEAPRRATDANPTNPALSALGHWPVQLRLVPPGAPFLRGADLLLVADCAPFAMADFHERLLSGRALAIACPKLDDASAHVAKLAAILRESSVRRLTVVHMEVPCCSGLVAIARRAIAQSGVQVPLDDVTISIRGQVLDPAADRRDTTARESLQRAWDRLDGNSALHQIARPPGPQRSGGPEPAKPGPRCDRSLLTR